MAKTYYEEFISSLETQYASGIVPVMSIAALNDRIKLVPIEGKGSLNTSPQIAIQRLKRLKAADSVYDNTKGSGDNYISRLNTAQRVDWETVEILANVKRDLLVKVPLNTQYEMDNVSADFQRAIDNITQNKLLELEEEAEAALAAAGHDAGTIDLTKGQEGLQLILDTARNIEFIVDDFKAYSNKVMILVHPLVADMINKLHGITWYGASDTFPNAPRRFTYAGLDFVVAPILNTIQGKAATEVIGAVVFDTEAFVSAGLDFNMVSFSDKLLDERVYGHTYSYINKVIDPDRVAKIEMTLPTGVKQSKKVNA